MAGIAHPLGDTSSAWWRNCGFRWGSAWSSMRYTGGCTTTAPAHTRSLLRTQRADLCVCHRQSDHRQQLGVSAVIEIPLPFSRGAALPGCGCSMGHLDWVEADRYRSEEHTS